MTQPDDERELADMELWSRRIIYEARREHFKQEFNFIEISRLPQRVNSWAQLTSNLVPLLKLGAQKSLASLVMSTSQIMPKKIDICYKTDDTDMKNPVAVIECRSENDAHRVIEKLRASPCAKFWQINSISDPKFVKPNLS